MQLAQWDSTVHGQTDLIDPFSEVGNTQEAARKPLAVDPTPASNFARRGKDVVDEAASMFTQWLKAYALETQR